jgi:ribosomal protein S27AE
MEFIMADQKDDNVDLLCGNCGETFSNFLHEMADQNAKVATCPKCGKIHQSEPSKTGQPVTGAGTVKKKI